MGLRADILELLADGSAHSGEALAERLGSSRTAVWKHVQHLAARGIAIEARRGIGYRIPGGLDLLDAAALSAALPAKARPLLAGLELVAETASTNERLLAAAERGDIHCRCLLAEYQSEGRGRRGRQWRCPYGAGVLLSLGWRFERGAEALAGLSLAAGVAVRDALAAAGIPGVGLKWPNDLYAGGRKLGGILVELRGEVAGGVHGETEREVASALFRQGSERTILWIAHRLVTLRGCDVIHLFRDGRRVASGTYDDLMDSSELFRSMAREREEREG